MTPPPDFATLSSSEKDALITALLARVDALVEEVRLLRAENAVLAAENAALREKLSLPPKTPDNSRKAPSQGQKPNADSKAKGKFKVHAGAHRPLHPNPTRRRDVLAERCSNCQTDVSFMSQIAVQAYDRRAGLGNLDGRMSGFSA